MAAGISELDRFTREALALGLARSDIKGALLKAGWNEAQVSDALGAYADLPFPVPVPLPRAQLSARDGFMYLVMFTTLYIASYNLSDVLFDVINHLLAPPAARGPDAAFHPESRPLWESIRWSMSALIVTLPTYLALNRVISHDVAQYPVKRLSPVRRWLTYMTLFVAACTLIATLTTLLYNALGGGLNLRLLLKILVVSALAGSAFVYYLGDLRRDEQT